MNRPGDKSPSQSEVNDFVREGQVKRPSFVSDYFHFLKNNKKWWLLPILLMVLVFGGLMVLGATGAAPFIYTLF